MEKLLVGKQTRQGGCLFLSQHRSFSKKKKGSSRRWKQRHVSDPFVKKAKSDNRVSRSYYKLEYIDKKYDVLQKKHRTTVIDLGASPGGWTSFAAGVQNQVLAMDLLEMDPKISNLPNVHFVQGDFTKWCVGDQLQQLSLWDENFLQNVGTVMSDIAPNFVGDQRIDTMRTAELCEQALEFSTKVLQPSGSFVGKLFSGPEEQILKKMALDFHFSKVSIVKPPASRSESSERFLVARGFLGA